MLIFDSFEPWLLYYIEKKQQTNKKTKTFLLKTNLLHLFPYKIHEDIPNGYRVMGCTRIRITQNKQKKNNQINITLKRKTENKYICTPHFGLTWKFHEDLYNGYCVWCVHIIYTCSNGHNSEIMKGVTIIIMWDTLPWPNIYLYKLSWRYLEDCLHTDGRTDSVMP